MRVPPSVHYDTPEYSPNISIAFHSTGDALNAAVHGYSNPVRWDEFGRLSSRLSSFVAAVQYAFANPGQRSARVHVHAYVLCAMPCILIVRVLIFLSLASSICFF